MGYVFRADDVKLYDSWSMSEPGISALKVQTGLLGNLWKPAAPKRVLEVGCGTGIFLDWLSSAGHMVTGIDASEPAVEFARSRLPHRVDVRKGYAERLPFEDNAFDTTFLITTLEFVDSPAAALSEAIRVARSHVVLGVFNRYSLIAAQRYIEGIWKRSFYGRAHFFSIPQLYEMVQESLSGRVPVQWRTCLTFPLWTLPYLRTIESSRLFQMQPFGHFIGMKIDLRYQLRTAQQPLFNELPHAVPQVPLRTSCWNLRSREESGARDDKDRQKGTHSKSSGGNSIGVPG